MQEPVQVFGQSRLIAVSMVMQVVQVLRVP
jgi:hypothetical protein